jgi:hypothetical protein
MFYVVFAHLRSETDFRLVRDLALRTYWSGLASFQSGHIDSWSRRENEIEFARECIHE